MSRPARSCQENCVHCSITEKSGTLKYLRTNVHWFFAPLVWISTIFSLSLSPHFDWRQLKSVYRTSRTRSISRSLFINNKLLWLHAFQYAFTNNTRTHTWKQIQSFHSSPANALIRMRIDETANKLQMRAPNANRPQCVLCKLNAHIVSKMWWMAMLI